MSTRLASPPPLTMPPTRGWAEIELSNRMDARKDVSGHAKGGYQAYRRDPWISVQLGTRVPLPTAFPPGGGITNLYTFSNRYRRTSPMTYHILNGSSSVRSVAYFFNRKRDSGRNVFLSSGRDVVFGSSGRASGRCFSSSGRRRYHCSRLLCAPPPPIE